MVLIYQGNPVTLSFTTETQQLSFTGGSEVTNDITIVQGVISVNGQNGPVVELEASDIPSSGPSDVQQDIDDVKADIASNTSQINLRIPTAQKGAINGVAPLNSDAKLDGGFIMKGDPGGVAELELLTGKVPDLQIGRGDANGVASLGADGKVPSSQLPQQDGTNFIGLRNANTNTPTITSSVGNEGDFYIVQVAGNTVLDGTGNWNVGDKVFFDEGIRQKVPGFLPPTFVISIAAGLDINVNNSDPNVPVVSNARIYGREYFSNNSYPIQIVVGTTFTNKLSLAANVEGGDYLLVLSYGRNLDSNGDNFEGELVFDGGRFPGIDAAFNSSGLGSLIHVQEPKESGGDIGGTGSSQVYGFSGQYPITLTAGAHTFDFNHRSDANVESSTWNVKMSLLRVG